MKNLINIHPFPSFCTFKIMFEQYYQIFYQVNSAFENRKVKTILFPYQIHYSFFVNFICLVITCISLDLGFSVMCRFWLVEFAGVQTSLRSAFNCFYDNKINSGKLVISDIFFTNMVISSIFLIEMVIFNIKSQSWIYIFD